MYFSWMSFKSRKRAIALGFFLSIIGIIGTFVLIFSFLNTQVKADIKSNILVESYKLQLEKQLINDLKGKVPASFIKKVFSSPKLKFLPELMIRRLTWKEAKLPYYQFLEPDRIKRAFCFLVYHKSLLESLEKHFGVDKEILTAIFLVETNLGKNTGKFPVIKVFYSLSLSKHLDLLKDLAKKRGIDLNNPKVINYIKKKSNWAYKELAYFLKICYQNHWDPFNVKGSIFGAFGYPQFIPKSYLIYGFDWDKNGIVDLYTIQDALASIANYLKKEGFSIHSTLQRKKEIIMKYNISEPYADTVLEIAHRLKLLENIKNSEGWCYGNSTQRTGTKN